MNHYKDPDKLIDILVEGYEAFDADFLESQDIEVLGSDDSGSMIINVQGKIQRIKIISQDYQNGIYTIRVNGRNFNCRVETNVQLLIKELGFNKVSKLIEKEIYAPMPGMVIDIGTNAGDEVVEGQVLLTLEAMKMENIIKATHDGTIEEVLVKKGDKVEKNQLLIRFK